MSENVIRMTADEFRRGISIERRRQDMLLELACRIAFPMDFLVHLAEQNSLWPHERKRIIACYRRLTKELGP